MNDPHAKPTIIDENGMPIIDVDNGAQSAGRGGGSTSGFPGANGMPGMAGMPGMPGIPEHLLTKDGKPSLRKILGWKGIAVVAALILIAIGAIALSVVALAIIVPIVIVAGLIGAVVAKFRGSKPVAPNARSVVVVRR